MDAEIALLRNETRRDPTGVDALLDTDFIEIGRSGRRWTRDEIVGALAAEQRREMPTTDEWLFNEIAPGLFLVTYRLDTHATSSRHSSIWDTKSGVPRIRFHQGTVIPPGSGGPAGSATA
ncbi:DUF4440 domain-containing protein [Microbacterium rhizomatis]|nr:DUF4440 domain-containing protein [Microbacterium rhizomatis]